jgi:hypothetical protein
MAKKKLEFLAYLSNKFDMTLSSVASVITRSEENFRSSTILLFHIVVIWLKAAYFPKKY